MLPKSSSGKLLAGITAGVVGLILVTVLVTLVADPGDPTPLPQGSPEASVQAYVRAIDEGEFSAAYAMLHADPQDSCNETDFRSQIRNGRGTGMRVSLDSVDLFEDNAFVTVRITSFNGSPPFDFSERSYTDQFHLKQTGDDWLIVRAPWPFGQCPTSIPVFNPTPTPMPTATPTVAPTAPSTGS